MKIIAPLVLVLAATIGLQRGTAQQSVPGALLRNDASSTRSAVRPENVGQSSQRLQRITDMIGQRIAAREIAGGVTMVARRGQVVHASAQGVADLESRQRMTPATLFHIASMTKPVIAAAIMVLVEEGKVRLDDPVARFIPSFRRDITITHLLTHTSGLGSGPVSDASIAKVARKEGEALADYIPRLGTTVLEFEPGTHWAYSSFAGFETLGHVVEIASGMRLDRFLRARIFNPLGMADITFWPSDTQAPRVATYYRLGPGGLAKTLMPGDTMSRNVYFRGSGGLYSSAESYIPFGMMLANGGELNGKRVLSRKSVETMTAVHVPDTLPGRPAGEGYGLGGRVVTNHAALGTMLPDGTYGWSGARGTHFFVAPREQLVGVLMVQTPHPRVRSDFENLVAQAIAD